MIPYIGCDAAREMLQPFVDGELAMPEQVALESHLRWCATCGARVEDLRLIGASLRLAAPAQSSDRDELTELAAIQSAVLARVRAEHDQSLGVRFRGLFEDMRYLWPALGASAALVVCVVGVLGIDRAARQVDPNSLADRLQMLANPGSDRNPVQLDARMLAPRLPAIEGPVLESIPENDVTFALAAVVTREGRVANYELLRAQSGGQVRFGDDVSPATISELMDETLATRDAVKHSRFTPARRGGDAVAVNVVWVLSRTTVKAPRGGYGAAEVLPPPPPAPDEMEAPISEEREPPPDPAPARS